MKGNAAIDHNNNASQIKNNPKKQISADSLLHSFSNDDSLDRLIKHE